MRPGLRPRPQPARNADAPAALTLGTWPGFLRIRREAGRPRPGSAGQLDRTFPGEIASSAVGTGEVVDLGEIEIPPAFLEQPVVDGHERRGRDPPYEVDGLLHRAPGCVDRYGEDVDRPGICIQGVTGMEERRLVRRPQDHPDVVDERDVLVDDGVSTRERQDLDTTDLRGAVRSEDLDIDTLTLQLVRGLRLGQHPCPGIGAQQGRDPWHVAVVRMLMGDQNRIQIPQLLESRREAARVDKDSLIRDLDE